MKLLFKQRLFSWFDSYDIYDEKVIFISLHFDHPFIIYPLFEHFWASIAKTIIKTYSAFWGLLIFKEYVSVKLKISLLISPIITPLSSIIS